jgi:glutamate carboxypeptidase
MPDGGVKTRRKGVAIYGVTARGMAVHAGIEGGGGVNAIVELATQIPRITALADLEQGTTVNVGLIRGGTASNVVPAEAWMEVDVRIREISEGNRIDSVMQSLAPATPGATLSVEGGVNRPPLERTPEVLALYERARAQATDLGFDLSEGASGGASDGCFTAAAGVPTLDGLGVLGDGAHAVHEHIVVDDIPRRVALYGRLLQTL